MAKELLALGHNYNSDMQSRNVRNSQQFSGITVVISCVVSAYINKYGCTNT